MPVTYNIVYQLDIDTKILRKHCAFATSKRKKEKKKKNGTTRPDWRGSEGPRKFIF